MPYMVTFTINIPQMLAFVYHTSMLWVSISTPSYHQFLDSEFP